ncbi:MAG: sialidase family protein [Pirellulaceae bacterium]
MHIERRMVVYDAAAEPADRQVAFFDSVFTSSEGSWFCGYTVGCRKHDNQGTIQLRRSLDGGDSWQVLPGEFSREWQGIPGSLTGAEMLEITPGRLMLFTTWFDRSEPERPLFDPLTEGILRSRLLVAESADDGESWSAWREIATPGLKGTAMTGPPVLWTDGTLGVAFESFKEFDDPGPGHHGSWLVLSRDGGRTFPDRYCVAQDPKHAVYYWDQRLTAGAEVGDYIGLFWTHDRASQRDLRVHFLQANVREGQAAPQLPTETTIPGQIAAPARLADGRLLAFVVDRDQPGTMRLWVSADQGRTWPLSDSLLVHSHDELARVSQGRTDVDYAQYWEDMAKWTFGHPAMAVLGADRVLVSYYAGVPGCMGIHAAVVAVPGGI